MYLQWHVQQEVLALDCGGPFQRLGNTWFCMLIMLLAVELQFCQSCNTTQAFPGNFETKNASQTDHCFAAQLNSCERQWLFRLPGCKCPSLPQLSFTALAKQPNSHFFVILFVHLFKKNASESFLASSFKALPCRSQKQKKAKHLAIHRHQQSTCHCHHVRNQRNAGSNMKQLAAPNKWVVTMLHMWREASRWILPNHWRSTVYGCGRCAQRHRLQT